MPKKTKKEKMLAELHRRLESTNLQGEEIVKSQIKTHQNTLSQVQPATYSFSNIGYTKPKNHIVTHDYTYLKHDLLKITGFTILALLFQGMLYFFVRTR
ncbi:hypothetical protein A2960_03550 [Candidatus Gottesmanbacteria bacterium RIFCSPLOWO2_01_FULL_39_12b]|uniref:Uncharacterized protein n=1 Tax=Candidatus Gottesmanbacteria bacterium RIFCSPLOWO2_01_FULL_39_12b TaxID=1798388 RepID=A0A1F6ANY5_9BACT|nr:MAG: hypothetical protein A2960_03550 [Candidatus Gottesmanbacteria bacterium RIFCSPLOWO2_01_FULL_39_12b]